MSLKKVDRLPLNQKVLLSLPEAAAYTGLGINALETLAKKPENHIVLYVGRKRMFKRELLEKYLLKTDRI